MRLYSVQPLFVYNTLLAGRVYRALPSRDPTHWVNDDEPARWAYEWLCEQMTQRGMLRPANDVFPVWAWQQWYGPKRPRPDLRTSSLKSWARTERHVLLELEVPDNEVLLHDYDAWYACLNYSFLGASRAAAAFDRRCKAVGKSPHREQPLKDTKLHAELVQSWQQIFDFKNARKALGHRAREQVVQATFWALRPEQVLSAVEFGMDRPLRPLYPSTTAPKGAVAC